MNNPDNKQKMLHFELRNGLIIQILNYGII